MQQCLFCGHMVQLIHVHGHYQCPVCSTNALPCCDGDNCHTNLLFNTAADQQPPAQELPVSNKPSLPTDTFFAPKKYSSAP